MTCDVIRTEFVAVVEVFDAAEGDCAGVAVPVEVGGAGDVAGRDAFAAVVFEVVAFDWRRERDAAAATDGDDKFANELLEGGAAA